MMMIKMADKDIFGDCTQDSGTSFVISQYKNFHIIALKKIDPLFSLICFANIS